MGDGGPSDPLPKIKCLMKRGPYRVHPARIELNRYGFTVNAIAARAGLSASAVSLQLAGTNRLTEPVRSALLEELGADAAGDVLAAIPSREEVAA